MTCLLCSKAFSGGQQQFSAKNKKSHIPNRDEACSRYHPVSGPSCGPAPSSRTIIRVPCNGGYRQCLLACSALLLGEDIPRRLDHRLPAYTDSLEINSAAYLFSSSKFKPLLLLFIPFRNPNVNRHRSFVQIGSGFTGSFIQRIPAVLAKQLKLRLHKRAESCPVDGSLLF